MQTLNLGQKFIPTPGMDTRLQQRLWAVSRYTRNIRLRAWFGSDDSASTDLKYHVPGSTWEPPEVPETVLSFIQDVTTALNACYDARPIIMQQQPVVDNMTPDMRRAMFELQHDPDIIIKPSDKNMGMCIMDRTWYISEALRMLGDVSTYRPTPAAAMPGIRSNLQRQSLQLCERWRRKLPPEVYKYIKSAAYFPSLVPYFYLLPKVHKLPQVNRQYLHLLKGRPIAACHSWVTNAMSVFLADVLNHACLRQFDHVLPDTRALVRLLESTTVSRDAYLVTFDVESMYPSIDNEAAITACSDAAAHAGYHLPMIQEMLQFVMRNGYCQFDGKYYQQIKGTVMGTPVAPPYSNIYIAACLEAIAKQQADIWPRIYKRFIDDGFFVWEHDEAGLIAFLQLLNSILPNIRLTWKYSKQSIDYMDVTVSKVTDCVGPTVGLKVTTYQKPHNQYMYIPWHSFHRRSVFKGFIKAELQRYAVTNTLPADFEHMKVLFMQRLLDRGYPFHQLKSWFAVVQHSCRVGLLSRSANRKQACQQPPVLVLPNGQFENKAHVSHVLNRVYAQHKHQPRVASIFGGSNAKLVVAYSKNRSLGARLTRARL